MQLICILRQLEKDIISYINRYTYMDMMYMEDAIDAIIKLMEEDSVKLKQEMAIT